MKFLKEKTILKVLLLLFKCVVFTVMLGIVMYICCFCFLLF